MGAKIYGEASRMTIRFLSPMAFDREALAKFADGCVIALAVSIPWSTTATGILAGLWLFALIPTLDSKSLQRVIVMPSGGLPVLLVALGGLGMLWATVPWGDRVNGVTSFLKLLCIPLLMIQFSDSARARHVLRGFLVSCFLLLIISWSLFIWPEIPWPFHSKNIGIPVKDYIAQSAMFTICMFVLAPFAVEGWRRGRHLLVLTIAALELMFLFNVFYIATSRTYLVVIAVLAMLFGYRVYGWKGLVALLIGCFLLAAAAWPSATYLRMRVGVLFHSIRTYQPENSATSAGERIVYWTKSLHFIEKAPFLGHGTGSIRDQFRRAVVPGEKGMASEISANPHNQVLAVGIQIGLVGIAVMLLMWAAHLKLFLFESAASWVGSVVVVQNIVGSLFNSHLFDFTQGWIYVVGVGVAGGVVLREKLAFP
jgi:O-antigen ligase